MIRGLVRAGNMAFRIRGSGLDDFQAGLILLASGSFDCGSRNADCGIERQERGGLPSSIPQSTIRNPQSPGAPETVLGANLYSMGNVLIMQKFSVIGAESSKELSWR
jgi:hypothetical protein